MTRDELQTLLDELDKSMPALKKDNPDEADFWPAFAGMADLILDGASAQDYDWVNQQTDAILAKHHMGIPPELPL